MVVPVYLATNVHIASSNIIYSIFIFFSQIFSTFGVDINSPDTEGTQTSASVLPGIVIESEKLSVIAPGRIYKSACSIN